MFSHAQTSRSHKLRNPRGHDEDSGMLSLTPRNPSKPQCSETLSAPARRSSESPSLSDCNELQETTLKKSPMILSVQPERKQTMNMRIRLMMTSVPHLNNFFSLHIQLWKKILSMITRMLS